MLALLTRALKPTSDTYPDVFTVTPSWGDFFLGTPRERQRCVIARAVRRTFGNRLLDVAVSYGDAFVEFAGEGRLRTYTHDGVELVSLYDRIGLTPRAGDEGFATWDAWRARRPITFTRV